MPALSQNLTFTVNSTSTTILNYPNTGTTALTYFSDRVKGDGYYGASDGYHTVQTQITNFVGRIEMQATLSSEPNTDDWFPVVFENTSTSTLSYTVATSDIHIYNFIGNFVWVRSKISNWTEGSVNGIKYNH